jgi:hypothetical protein
MGEIEVFSNCIFAGSSLPLIVFKSVFDISATCDSKPSSKLKSDKNQDLLASTDKYFSYTMV